MRLLGGAGRRACGARCYSNLLILCACVIVVAVCACCACFCDFCDPTLEASINYINNGIIVFQSVFRQIIIKLKLLTQTHEINNT